MAITPETPGGINAPNDLSSEAASSVAAPNTLTSESAGSVAAPNTLTSETAGAIAAPNTLSSEAASSVAAPNTLTSESAGSVAAPNTIGAVTAAALPRTLTPMLKLNFAHDSYQQNGTAKSLLDIATYSRASSASFTNRRLNAYNQYEYFVDTDYVGDVENLLTYSEQFENSAWIKVNSATVTANATNAPDGSMSADKLSADTNINALVHQTATVVTGQEHTFSVYLKNVDSSKTILRCSMTGKNVSVNWSGNMITSLSDITSGASASYKKIGDFYRVNLTFTPTGAVEGTRIYPDYLNGTGSIYAWGAQLTESAKPLPYVKTIDTTVTKAFTESLRLEYDPETGESLGALIEGGSTNLCLRSEEFDIGVWAKTNATVTANATIAPDGTTSADSLVGTTTSNFIRQTLIAPAGVLTFSVWVKAKGENIAFNAGSSSDVGSFVATSEWKRYEHTFTDAGGSQSYGIFNASSNQLNLYVWGAQLEQLPFASSYIRTEGSAVSRSADNLSMPSAGNFNASEYTVATKMNTDNFFSSSVSIASIGGNSDRTQIDINGGNFRPFSLASGSSSSFSGSAIPLGITTDLAIVYNNNNTLDGYFNNVSEGSISVPPMTDMDTINLGNLNVSSQKYYGHIAEFSTYNIALTAQEVSIL